MPSEYRRENFTISTDKNKLDLSVIHAFLRESSWSKGIPLEVVRRAVEHSLCFGVYDRTIQIGFARVITDYATFAYVADVFILEPYRLRGLARWLMQGIVTAPDLRGLQHGTLLTKDAHKLYAGVGFSQALYPEWVMELHNPDAYKSS